MELPLDRPAGILIKTTLVDYPGHVAGSFFLKGCNLRCPYCYNIGLVLPEVHPDDLSTVEELFDHLEKRRNVLSGLVISGGEPLVNAYTPIIIKKAKEQVAYGEIFDQPQPENQPHLQGSDGRGL